jgi:hypothetical protein
MSLQTCDVRDMMVERTNCKTLDHPLLTKIITQKECCDSRGILDRIIKDLKDAGTVSTTSRLSPFGYAGGSSWRMTRYCHPPKN